MARAIGAIVLLTPAKNLNKVFRGFLVVAPLVNQLLPLSLSPPPSELCNDENNSVIRSAMDALRNSKKIAS